MFDALRAGGDALGGDQMRLVVKYDGRRGRRQGRPRGLRAVGRDIVRRLARRDDFIEAANTFRVRGLDPETATQVELDLLDQKLISQTTVALVGKNRVVASGEMLEKIVGTYHARADENPAGRRGHL